MSGIQPAGLTDAELLHYCWLTGYDKLEPAWVEELAKRLKEATNWTAAQEAWRDAQAYGN